MNGTHRAIVIPPGPRLGRSVLSVKGLSKAYGDRTLFSGLDFTVDAGSVVGVVRRCREKQGGGGGGGIPFRNDVVRICRVAGLLLSSSKAFVLPG